MTNARVAEDDSLGVHLAHGQIAAFIDGRLGTTDREDAERHLAACAECRSALREVQRAFSSVRRPRWGLWIPLATSAAAVLAFFVVPRMTRQITAPEELRSAPVSAAPVAAPLLAIISPRDGAHIGASDSQFVWHSVGRNVTYRFLLSDLSGATLWSADTPDTVVSLPSSVKLVPRSDYFWFVDANFTNGRSTKTPAIRVARR